jgi:hypothetical protein
LLYILDEVTLPTITVKVTGFLIDGPKSYVINKIKNTKLVKSTYLTFIKYFLCSCLKKIKIFIRKKQPKEIKRYHSPGKLGANSVKIRLYLNKEDKLSKQALTPHLFMTRIEQTPQESPYHPIIHS